MAPKRILHGTPVLDADEHVVGRIEEVLDAQDLAIVRLGRFGAGTKLLPIAGARLEFGLVQLPFSSAAIEDAPAYDRARSWHSQVDHARAHWGEHVATDARRLGYERLARMAEPLAVA